MLAVIANLAMVLTKQADGVEPTDGREKNKQTTTIAITATGTSTASNDAIVFVGNANNELAVSFLGCVKSRKFCWSLGDANALQERALKSL